MRHDAAGRVDLEARYGEVRSWFSPDGLQRVLGPARSETERIAHAWLAKGGKRWRPLLVVCVFDAVCEAPGEPLPEGLREAAVAVECFHKASLIHDDIEDHDSRRYGEKTLHEQYGVPVALNVGDFLLGEGYRLLAEAEMGGERKARMLRAAAWGHRNLCIGQGEELASRRHGRPATSAEVIGIFRRKTAPAFEVALRLGAVYAGADEGLWPALDRYSECLGIAYQIRDDLADVSGRSEVEEGRTSHASILEALAGERADMDTEAAAQEMLGVYLKAAADSLEALDHPVLWGLLRRVLGKMFGESDVGQASGGERRTTGCQRPGQSVTLLPVRGHSTS